MKLSGKIIAVSGSPSSGKTLTAVKIAKALADFKRQVILVCCDEQVPAIPLLIPESDESTPNLGSLLRLSEPSPITVLRHCIPFGKSGLIGLLGYRIGDQSPPQDVGEKGSKLFSVLRSCADYTVIDCGPENPLASPTFDACDIRYRLFNAGLKSFVFFAANKKGEEGKAVINVLNNLKPNQDASVAGEGLGPVPYVLPHVPDLEEQYDAGKLYEPVYGSPAKKYAKVIRRIVIDLLDHES